MGGWVGLGESNETGVNERKKGFRNNTNHESNFLVISLFQIIVYI